MSTPNWFVCVGGPFDGRSVCYTGTPKVIVLMEDPRNTDGSLSFIYHDYRQIGTSNHYRYVDKETP